MCSLSRVKSAGGSLRVARSECDSSGQLSDDAGVAHQLGEHAAVLHNAGSK